ncbi:hypothetical protein EYZ11_001949 [Aspergillus tanneri]|uniref:Alpha/beta hydrolase fold-3 domain-containing protein n=1 Tax=Aspergillus tanneri TaxID=1220188 RepID=A0A4S3JTN4_9EURO|nr:uncharacterized protein ATNIH1004_007474 [Aspergillus tanneri]KAA8646051.1 hypothetical protein ATNIH1004_007474 [Aspergillus tanneri]THC98597.1 hypothetical protein EYZ11_001949 [Aspergillus tanneri]
MTTGTPKGFLHPDLEEAQNSLTASGFDLKKKEDLAAAREMANFKVETVMKGREGTISYEDLDVPGPAGPLRATVLRSKKHSATPAADTPGILYIHGGAHLYGNRFFGLNGVLDWVESLGAMVVSAEYRLSPENPQPAQINDTFATLTWMSEHANDLGFNPRKLIVSGGSAGGNLAAGVTLMARDQSGPEIVGLILTYPWVGENTETSSMLEYGNLQPWARENTIDALNFALGENRENATIYTVPSRSEDLTGLPPTFIDVGTADLLRDEDVDFATALWKAGGQVEFHVWPGAWHGFDVFVPDAPISRRAIATRLEWLQNLINNS